MILSGIYKWWIKVFKIWKCVDSPLKCSNFPLLRSWFTHIHTLFLSHTQHQDALCGCEKLIKGKALLLNYKDFTISNNCIWIRCLTDCFWFLNTNLFWFLNFDKRMVFINHKQSQANSVKMKVGWTIVANVLLSRLSYTWWLEHRFQPIGDYWLVIWNRFW